MMLRAATFLIGVCVAGAVGAADALRSETCLAALGRLDAQEARQASAPAGDGKPTRPSKALQLAQQAVAAACLGVAEGATAAPRQAQPVPLPPRAPAAAPAVVPQLAVPSTAAPLPPIVVPPPPPFVTACDATGCWSSDGRRLDRVGPDTYFRDRQLCTARGGLLYCP